ncbi:hypothetical protein ACFDTO_14945 [Microbacteriaceae bacterium 4G12]
MFPLGEQPNITKNLTEVTNEVRELAIDGKTKNLERLSNLKIEKLWIFSVNQKQFDEILTYVTPDILYIYEMRVADLSMLQKLSNLKELYMCWNTKNTDLWDLSYNKNLTSLLIEEFSKLEDLTPIKDGIHLQSLYLSGGIVKALHVQTLKPLSNLVNLNKLTLMNIKVKDDSLEPLMNLKEIKELNLSNQFPTEEYAKLSVVLSNTKCNFFKPYVYIESLEGKDIMVIGKKKPFLNSKTDIAKIQKYEEQFKKIQEQFGNEMN